ncbi:MAG: heparinase II/III family protein [bacterium]
MFFELFANAYADSANLALLPEGKVRLIPLGVEDVGNFDWRHHARADLSWWMRIEDLQYLLPAINSVDVKDKRLAREWVAGWCEAHERDPRPNPGAWQPMTAGIRALVLVRFLKELHDSGESDTGLDTRIRESILEHQRFLEKRENFEGRSNHGMWEALGLFETVRVTGGAETAAFALRRLTDVVNLSVSGMGIHKEHAAAYHFYFSRWLSDFVRYLETLDVDVGALSGVAARMRGAAYYLIDHGGNVPQIGDTDAMRIDPDSLGTPEGARDRVLFDESGGIAVFKDPPGRDSSRYIAFNIRQLRNLRLSLAHTHRDILAVYFSCDGEVILGDGGRYGYTDSVPRRYFVSSAAHNTIIPMDNLDSSAGVTGPIGGITPALEHGASSVAFVGNLNRRLAVRPLRTRSVPV